jgi:hypothetical protein
MKTIIEDNYLGFKLTIKIDSVHKVVSGFLTDSYPWGDEVLYSAFATCQDIDKFSEVKGIKLVKLKIAKMYHASMQKLYSNSIRSAEKSIKTDKAKYDFHNRKLSNIDLILEKEFELKSYKKKPTKKVTKKKTTKKTSKKG